LSSHGTHLDSGEANDDTMTTQPKTLSFSKGAHSETTTRQIAPLLSQGEFDVGSGSRVQPSKDQRGICKFEIQNYSKGENYRLGYTNYVAQGGDWGNAVSEVMALQQPPGLLGIHTNMAATVPPDVSKALAIGGPPPTGLSPEEKHAWDQLDDFYKNGLGYAIEMNNRPQTLYGIVDSPVGLASWMIDHDIRSYQMIARVFDGKTEGLTRDDVLDNVTLYWLTNTAISSALLYWDTRHNLPAGGFFDVRGVKLPVGVSAFAEEIYQAPKSWAEKAYVKLIHYNKLPKGTHFAAWEQPALFVSEVRATFKSLR
jgi:pimeloyl-ACP methyl ester carboxylesterase